MFLANKTKGVEKIIWIFNGTISGTKFDVFLAVLSDGAKAASMLQYGREDKITFATGILPDLSESCWRSLGDAVTRITIVNGTECLKRHD